MDEFITKPKLETKTTAGVVGQPGYSDGEAAHIARFQPDMKNTGTNINISYSTVDEAHKWERPHPQDVPEAGRNQYM